MMLSFLKISKTENTAKALVKQIIKNHGDKYWSDALKNLPEVTALKEASQVEQKRFVLDAIDYFVSVSTGMMADNYYAERAISWNLVQTVMRKNLAYTETEWIDLFTSLNAAQTKLLQKKSNHSVIEFPINHAIQQIERYLKNNELSEALNGFIKNMLSWQLFDNAQMQYWGTDLKRSVTKLKKIIQDGGETLVFTIKTQDIGEEVMAVINGIEQPNAAYHSIFHLAQAASGSKPTAKFSKSLKSYLAQLDKNHYRKTAHALLQIAIDQPIKETEHEHHYDNKVLHYTITEYLCDNSKQFIKGIVWTLDGFSDKTTISLLENLLYKSYTKIPEIGAAAAAVGNACIYVLGNMRGKDGLGALSRARLKLKQNNVKKLIQKQLDAGAEKYGVSVAELEEMAVPDFGLVS